MRLCPVLAVATALAPASARAQHITIDGTLSPAQTLTGPNYVIGATLGKQVGGNLFQSFGIFGLASGESADFTGPGNVGNIIGRVTGGGASAIDGLIRSSIAGANLFLINPYGIVFGPNATVNVSGSFYASTADYLKMADGNLFQATHPNGSTLSAAAPAAFGFLTSTPAAITVNGSSLTGASGQTLGLIGGPVTINGGALTAPRGTIQIASTAGPGEVPIDPALAPSAAGFGPVAIGGGARIEVTGGGNIFIDAGALSIVAASQIVSDNAGAAAGGSIAIDAGTVTLDGGAAGSRGTGIFSKASGAGTGDTASLDAAQLTIESGAALLASASGSGNGGAVTVTVGGTLALASGASLGTETTGGGSAGNVTVAAGGAATIDMATGARASVLDGIGSLTRGAGNAGRVAVAAGSLSISDGGEVSGVTFGAGRGGDVAVTVGGLLSIDGTGEKVPTGILSDTEKSGNGDAGNVAVTAGALSMQAQGEIGANTFGAGNGGDVTVTVSGLLTIAGVKTAAFTGIAAESNPDALGDAGNIAVSAGTVSLTDGGVISSTTFGPGAGGSVSVTVTGLLAIAGTRGTSLTGIAADSDTGATGNAGSVTVNAGSLSVTGGGQISSNTLGSGAGGKVAVSAGQISIADGGEIASDSSGSGDGGRVTVVAGQLALASDGRISSETYGSGNGGSVVVDVAGTLTVDSEGATGNYPTSINARTAADSSGDGGRVHVAAGSILLIGPGKQLTGDSGGSGRAGAVTVTAGSIDVLDGAAISTEAAAANGGDIALDVSGLLFVQQGSITASVRGVRSNGNGGNLDIDAGELVLDDGQIVAEAVLGRGGNIAITAGAFIPSAGSLISASSQLGVSGTIVIEGPRVDLNGSLVVLPSGLRGCSGAGLVGAEPGRRQAKSAVAPGATELRVTGGHVDLTPVDPLTGRVLSEHHLLVSTGEKAVVYPNGCAERS